MQIYSKRPVRVAVILLLLTAYFQSLRLAFVVVSTVPAVLTGVVLIVGYYLWK